ncbi:unnamed protein product [Ceutorhynchus assimilis]|uniref:Anoctamin n=1 Tax=Ceutorhynchus assimilis TaxID=467358 RepID=A0A9N9QKR9_9CUCU|nr:unnamed protein product [Ceutorhynchus assimilis]
MNVSNNKFSIKDKLKIFPLYKAFVIAFTSSWVSRLVYRWTKGNGHMDGYFNYTLSQYATKDYEKYSLLAEHRDYCYIRDYVHRTDTPQKYDITETYWIDFTFKIITIFLFEHIVLVCNVLLAYVIPFTPETVRQQLDLNEQKKRDARLAECKRELDARLKQIDLTKNLQGLKIS